MTPLGYFREDPEDASKCQLVLAIDGTVYTVDWSRNQCINTIRQVLPFVEKIPNCKNLPQSVKSNQGNER